MSIQFLHSEVLWALLALILPIIIHLFNFKRFKKIYFSNLKFLKNLSIQNKRRSKLKKWLLLLLRMLALACLIVAFSHPYIPENKNQSVNSLQNECFSIYIDNSFSMNAETENGNALEVAKNKAFELINGFPAYAKIRIYSNNFSPFSSSLTKQQAIARIQEINPSPVSVKLSEQLKKIKINNADESCRLYVFSDFQKTQSDLENITTDSNSTLSITFLPLSVQRTNNLLIDSCWFEKPYHQVKQTQELFVRIQNTSNQDYQKIPIKLSINDSIKSVSNFDIDRNASQIIRLKYVNHQAGIYNGKVEISDFPITYDNSLFFSYHISKEIHILSVNQNEPNKYLDKLFSETKTFNFKNSSKSQIFNENLESYQLIVLNEIEEMESGFMQVLKNYLTDGGHLLFIPGEKNDNSINFFLNEISAPKLMEIDSSKQKLAKIELSSELYQNVFEEIKKDARLPDVFRHYKLEASKNKLSEKLWRTQGGDNLLTKLKYGNGQFFLLSMNLNHKWTNLVTHPLFVPTFVNLTRSNSNTHSLYYILGKQNTIRTNSFNQKSDNNPFHIQNGKLKIDVIPEQANHFDKGIQLYPGEQISTAENYFITRSDSVIYQCSFNYSREESKPEYYSIDEIKAHIKNRFFNIFIISPDKMKLSELYNEQSNGRQYWKLFILLCFLFFVSEAVLQRVELSKPS